MSAPKRACQACGYRFDAHLGKYGCPNCQAEGLDDVTTDGELPAGGGAAPKTCNEETPE